MSGTNAWGCHAQVFNYDYLTGNVSQSMDANSQKTFYTYNHPFHLLTDVQYPDGGETQYCYTDWGGSLSGAACSNSGPFQVYSAAKRDSGTYITSVTTYDGLGRATRDCVTSLPTPICTDTIYDGLGQVWQVSNPYQGASPTDWTAYLYDPLGRKIQETKQDSSTLSWCYDRIANAAWSSCPTNQSTVANATWVNSQDEAGHIAQHVSDGMGHLAAVMEQQPSGTNMSLETDYTYNALDDLTAVNQKGASASGDTARSRSFGYDSLSRLTSSTNPETGTILYSYLNPNNTLCSGDPSLPCYRTDARNVSTYYTYDALNRPTGTSYSDGTPATSLQYDWTLIGCSPTPGSFSQCNTVGRLSYVSRSDGSSDGIYGYDPMGRVTMNTTCLFAQCPGYNSYDPREFAYDLAGHLIDIWYPRDDGTPQPHVQQSWDGAGRLSKVFTMDDGYEWDYLQGATYYPSGQASSVSYGNGVVENVGINSRLQTTSITAANALSMDANPNAPGVSGFAFMSRNYSYNSSDGLTGACSPATANNGEVWKITDNLNPTLWNRQFKYDCLDRLTGAQIGSNPTNYSIDSFGNMSPLSGSNPISTFDSATNRIGNLPCSASLPAYDAAGNQLCDTDANGANAVYTIDAEERQTAVTVQGGSSPYVSFTYSPVGERIQKADADGTLTQYMYGLGQLLSEKDQNGNWTDYIYANGAKIAAHHTKDVALHLHGTATAAGGYGTYFINGPLGYTVKSGDKLVYRQYQTANTSAGLAEGWFYEWGGFDPLPEDYLSTLGSQDGWTYQTVDLSRYAGGQFQSFRVIAFGTAAGDFDAWFADMAIVSSDGSVVPISTRGGSSSLTQYQVSDATNVSFAVDTATVPSSTTAETSTTYFLGDNIGTTQYEVSSGGWPIYAGQFSAWGQELAQPIPPAQVGAFIGEQAPENFKFTGKERDPETGNDYFGARYYTSGIGRFMSPDWSATVEPVPYSKLDDPQTLNLYAYAGNNPISGADLDGHQQAQSIPTCRQSEKVCKDERGTTAQENKTAGQNTQSQSKKWSPYIAVGDNGPTYLVNGHRGRQETYKVMQFRDGKVGFPAQDHTIALHETVVSGTLSPHSDICNHNNCSGRGSMLDTQGTSFRDPPLVIRRDWTIDGLPARVWDPNTNKPASYQILHLQAQPDFVMEYKP